MEKSFISKEIQWLTDIIVTRVKLYFDQESEVQDILMISPVPAKEYDCAYSRYIEKHDLGFEDRLLLILALVPTLKPELLDCFQVKNTNTGMRFTEFGCIEKDGFMLPTLSTALFIFAADDLDRKIKLADYYMNHPLFQSQLFEEGNSSNGLFSDWILKPSNELLDLLIFERTYTPRFSSSFPATAISTTRSWDELVLDQTTMQQVNDIKMWVKYGEKVRKEWELDSKLKPGFRALFYGPSGSGKTFTATLLGKEVGKQVFSIDLSLVVSKYIGETEKNLSKVFEIAEDKDWILFFDEADALFGKRTNVKDSHDRYANQEVAYLLQRVENYNGLVILSTNLKSNIDEAFARRFQIMVGFNMPNAKEREQLWRNTFSDKCTFEEGLDLTSISEKYEISGGSILNVVQYCSLLSMSRGENVIRKDDLLEGIRKEYSKVGKMMKM